MADAVLDTARLILRPTNAADLSWILTAINTPAMMRHLGGDALSADAVAQSLADDIDAFARPDGHRRWTVLSKETGERVARCGLFHVRSLAAPDALRGQREIGWMLAEAHWGKGYATEAARGVLDHAFGALALPVVYAQTSDSNAGSTRMMQRLGLSRRAEFDYVDPDYPSADNPTTVWSITADDWSRPHG